MTGDRAARGRSEPAGAPGPDDIPVAATVVIVRDGPGGPEVLLIERPDRGSFAGAWVFPGGKIEPGDPGETELDRARSAGIRETHEETGLVLTPGELVPLSRWVPPTSVALRIRTWFFVAPDPGGPLLLAADEAVRGQWMRPADALDRHGRGELTLYPPTWVTLHDLSGQHDAGDIVTVTRLGGLQEFETVTGPGPLLLWQGDADYDPDDATSPDARHRLDIAQLPWVYTRG